MGKHDFTQLYERYASTIASMEPEFNSHQFILELARGNQAA